jgi:hypothetical protein
MNDTSFDEERTSSAVEAVAGLLAAAAIALAAVAVAYRPGRLAPVAIVLAIIAAVMTERWARLGALAVALAGLAWFVGMTIAVITGNPIF